MAGVRWILQSGIAEALQQKGDPLVAVAAVRVPGMREKANEALVELHAFRRLWTIGGHGAFRALCGNGSRSVG